MGKNKLKKFADMETYDCVFQYPFSRLRNEGFELRGQWHERYFGNNNPIVLELGCGKGEYTVGLARRRPDRNYIGVDIKGARMWTGASEAVASGMTNVAFLRTSIELIDAFFAPGEVSEIWITFPDPQMKKATKRLTSDRFLDIYARILRDGGIINLKTDSPFLYTYTSRLVAANGIEVIDETDDLYATADNNPVKEIKTYYEQQWLARGKTIKYISFRLPSDRRIEPVDDSDIDRDDYHSYPRGIAQCMPDQLALLNKE